MEVPEGKSVTDWGEFGPHFIHVLWDSGKLAFQLMQLLLCVDDPSLSITGLCWHGACCYCSSGCKASFKLNKTKPCKENLPNNKPYCLSAKTLEQELREVRVVLILKSAWLSKAVKALTPINFFSGIWAPNWLLCLWKPPPPAPNYSGFSIISWLTTSRNTQLTCFFTIAGCSNGGREWKTIGCLFAIVAVSRSKSAKSFKVASMPATAFHCAPRPVFFWPLGSVDFACSDTLWAFCAF